MNQHQEILQAIFQILDQPTYWLDCYGVRGIGVGFPDIQNNPYLISLTIFSDGNFHKRDSGYTSSIKMHYKGISYSIIVDVEEPK